MVASIIERMLRSRWMFHLGAVALTYIYWWSGLTKMFGFAEAQAEMAHFGLNPPALFVIATIIVQLAGSALIISGNRFAWLGAGALGVFTLSTIPLAHTFWNMQGVEAFLDKTLVQEHFTVVGGLVLAAILAEVRRAPTLSP